MDPALTKGLKHSPSTRNQYHHEDDKIEKNKVGISVIIPNFNGEKVLRFSLTSLANQTFPKEMYEIIIVDNASSDNSLKILEELVQRYQNCSIKVIRLKKNLGYGRAINIGALHARFDLILVSNNDIIFHPKYLENLYKVYSYARKKDEKVAAAQGLHMYYPDVLCVYNAGGLLSILTGHYRFYGKCLTSEDFSKVVRWAQEGKIGFSYIAFPNGAGALIDRKVFLRLGGYYRLYFSGIEEIDLGILLHMLGYRVIFIPSAILYHKEGYTLGGRSTILVPHKLYLILAGIYICMISLYGPSLLIKSLVTYLLPEILILIRSFFKREKVLVWAVMKSLQLNIRMTKVLKLRRSKVMRIINIQLNEIISYLKYKDKYLSYPKLFASFIIRYL